MKSLLLSIALMGACLPVVLAAFQEPQATVSDPAKEKARAIERAREVLADKLKVAASSFTLDSIAEATWSNTSLGCPEPDHMYAQVVSKGFAVVLSEHGEKHEVHVAGRRAMICKSPSVK